MADRLNNLSGYSTMQPNGFPMGSPQQQFIPRHPQQQQGAPGPSQSVPDMQRLMQYQQMEKYRAQMGGEPMNSQVNAQMEFMRNQAAMHAHNQGQGQQQNFQQNPPQFSNIAAMNGMNQGQPSQSPALQNQRPVMPQQMSFNNGNQGFPQNPAQLVARNSNPAMLLQNAPNAINGITPNGISRQLELLGTARNQLPQNGPGPMRIHPILQSGNTSQAGMQGQNTFQPPAMFPPTGPNGARTSPAMQQAAISTPAGALTSAQQSQIQQMSRPYLLGPGNVHLSMEETARKVASLKEEVIEKEGRLRSMANNNDNHPMMKEMIADVQANKILLQRLMGYLQKAVQQGIISMQTLQNLGVFRNDSQGTANQSVQQNINNGVPPQQSVNAPQKPPQLAPPNSQQNWSQATLNGYSGQQNFNNQQPTPSVQSQGLMSNSPPNMNQFHPPPTLNRHPTPLSQTGPPHQQMMQAIMNRQGGPGHTSPQPGQGPSIQMPPTLQQSGPPGGVPGQQQQLVPGTMKRPASPPPTIPQGMMVPPLEATKFQSGLGTFLQRKNVHLDTRLLSVDNRQIDLYALHTETMRLGGPAAVSNSPDMWEVIAAKLGWNNFPGNGNEPGRSAPHIANHISNVYREYLAGFEASYIRLYVQGRQGALAQHQLSRFMQYAHVTSDELRIMGIPENVIQQIENGRPMLQKLQAARDSVQQQQQQLQQMNNAQSVGVSGASSLPPQQQQQPFAQQMSSGPPPSTHSENVPQHGLSNMANASGAPVGPRQGYQLNSSQAPASFTQLKPPSPSKPSAEQIHQANSFIQRCKEEYSQNRPHHLATQKQVHDQEKPEFVKSLEELCKICLSVDKLLAAFHAVFNDVVYTTRLIHIIMTANDQRQLLQRGTGRYLFDLTMTRQMNAFVRHAYEAFNQALHLYRSEGHNNNNIQSNLPPSGPPPSQLHNMAAQFERQQQPHQTLQTPMQQPTAQQIQPLSNPSLRPQQPGFISSPHQQPMSQPIKRKVTPMPGADSSPSPAASASTPVASANAATPSHIYSSPQTPKSPKTKAPPKKAPAKRKLSKATKPPAPQAEPAPTIPQPTLKRPREEEEIVPATLPTSTSAPVVDVLPVVKAESPAQVASASTIDRPPSAKRLKAEWSAPSGSDELKKDDEIETIKTNEDAAKFYDEMSELLKNTDPSGGLSAEVSDALQQILSSMGTSLEHIEPVEPVIPIAGPSEPPAPKSPQPTDWVDFFDFSSFTAVDDDAGSKADTPELVLTSSANPSPESASETDGHTHGATADTAKIADSNVDDIGEAASDPLRLGFWAEIDGGESAYYNSTEWKWDGPMGSSDNNWAFLQS